MQRNNRRQRTKGRRQRNNGIQRSNVNPRDSGKPMVMYNRSRSPFPPRLNTMLTYAVQSTLTFSGQTRANFRYAPTNLYDVNPLVGSTVAPGFAEYAAMYRYYQVKGYTIKVDWTNQEAFSVIAYICPVNSDPLSNYANVETYLANNRCKQTTLGPLTGMSKATLRDRLTVRDIGEIQVSPSSSLSVGKTDGSSAPPDEVYHTVGIVSSTNLTSAGVLVNVTIRIEVEFYQAYSPDA